MFGNIKNSILLLAILATFHGETSASNSTKLMDFHELEHILDKLHYHKLEKPGNQTIPVEVDLQIQILKFGPLHQDDFTIELTVIFR